MGFFETVDKIKSFIGLTIGIFCYVLWLSVPPMLYFGGIKTRLVIGLLLVYQYKFSKKFEPFRNLLKCLKPYNYFNSIDIIKEEPLQDSNSLFSFHPHGAGTMGFSFAYMMDETIDKSIALGSRVLIALPLSGLLATWLGLTGVNQENFKKLMKNGIHIII